MSSSSASTPKKGALIFLHGLGDSPLGWSSLERQLPSIKPRLANIVYVFPPAPTVAISINGGMRMPGWFDLYDWPIGVGSKDDKKGKMAAVKQIEREVEKLEKDHGIDRSRIVVGGFSQGGAIALLNAYHESNTKPYAGVAALSAWLTLVNEVNKVDKDVASKTPCFWAHGQYDDKVLFEQQKFGVEKLSELGVDVEFSHYPMGHESHPKEIESLASFLDKIFFGNDESTEL